MAQDQERLLALADLARFVAACYYEPGPEFTEERVFDSMAAAAEHLDPVAAQAVCRLGDAFVRPPLQELLIDYTRLFLGPGPSLASPYGSVWLSGENLLMQDSTMAVVALYSAAGFDIDEQFRELPDHVAAELEFLYLLLYRAAETGRAANAQAFELATTLRSRLLDEHLGRWIEPFTAAMQAGAQTAFYRELAQLTARVVQLAADAPA